MASAWDRADVMTRPFSGASIGPARAAGNSWRRRTALVLASVSALNGCYTTRSVTTAPGPGTTVLLDLNDRGRFLLGDRIGPSASRIEGVVETLSDTAYMVRISSVEYLNGQSNKWSGEPFTVPIGLVSGAQLREFSRARTISVGAGIAAALVTVFLKTNFLGSATNPQAPPPLPGGSS
jgi:hypothetical protein